MSQGVRQKRGGPAEIADHDAILSDVVESIKKLDAKQLSLASLCAYHIRKRMPPCDVENVRLERVWSLLEEVEGGDLEVDRVCIQAMPGTGKTLLLNVMSKLCFLCCVHSATTAMLGSVAQLLWWGRTWHKYWNLSPEKQLLFDTLSADRRRGAANVRYFILDEAQGLSASEFDAQENVFEQCGNTDVFVLFGCDFFQKLLIHPSGDPRTNYLCLMFNAQMFEKVKMVELYRNFRLEDEKLLAFVEALSRFTYGNGDGKVVIPTFIPQKTFVEEEQCLDAMIAWCFCDYQKLKNHKYRLVTEDAQTFSIDIRYLFILKAVGRNRIMCATNMLCSEINTRILAQLPTVSVSISGFDIFESSTVVMPNILSGAPPREQVVYVGGVYTLECNLESLSCYKCLAVVCLSVEAHTFVGIKLDDLLAIPIPTRRIAKHVLPKIGLLTDYVFGSIFLRQSPRALIPSEFIIVIPFCPVSCRFRQFSFTRFCLPIKGAYACTFDRSIGQNITKAALFTKSYRPSHGLLAQLFSRTRKSSNLLVIYAVSMRMLTVCM